MYKLHLGDCLEKMKDIKDNTIDLTVTSPPYDNLRDYNGHADSWNFDKFKDIATELYRITKKGGVVVWVVGDATVKGSETCTSFKQALYFRECGFNLHDTMIYQKKNPIPMNHNRYEQSFEYMFVFSKGKPKTFNPLRVECKNAGKVHNMNNSTFFDNKQCRRVKNGEKEIINSTKIRTNIFEYGVGGGRSGHPAPFPEKLAEDHILSWSNKGDLVFDPFTGSGTTGKMALLNKRDFIGIEIDEGYFEIARNRIEEILNN